MIPTPAHLRSTALRDLRWVGMAEGLSFLVLLGVAMPMKYAFGVALAVRVVGMIHGILFVVFVAAAIRAAMTHGWRLSRLGFALLMSVIPGGTFYLDVVLRREERLG